jgi:hypothetical protein
MAITLDILRDAAGDAYLVAEVDGAKVIFATVTATQINVAQVEQGIAPAPPNATDPLQGAYTGPATDLTPSVTAPAETPAEG